MKKISVLLTAAGGFGTPGTIDCLKNNKDGRKIRVICSDMVDQPIIHFKADKFYLLPKGNSKRYLERLIKICKKEKINVIMPGSSPEIRTISKNIKKLRSQKIIPTVSKFSVIKKIMNKHMTYEILKKNNIPVPKFYRVRNEEQFKLAIRKLGYPKKAICFKPSNYLLSGGSRGFRILRKKNSIEKIILKNKPGSVELDYDTSLRMVKKMKNVDLLIMEFLPGVEYSVYVLANKGKMEYCVPHIRQRLEQHYSFEAKVKKSKKIFEICKKVTENLNLDYNVNIQIRLSSQGKPKIIEINPRMGGTISLSAAAGINLPCLAINLALNERLPKRKIIYNTKMIRYWKEFFVNKNTHAKNHRKLRMS